jgi:ribosomal protein S18 acetylase RimI-like enzyme
MTSLRCVLYSQGFRDSDVGKPHVAITSADEDRGPQQRPSSSASSTYRIRALQPVDLDGISRVHWRACRIAYRFMNWSYTEDEVRRWYGRKHEAWDWGQVVCAEDIVVAYLAASGAHIDQLFVDPDYQGAGLGSALLTAMLERRLRPATLHVFAENGPARAFYERFGFRQVDTWWDAQDRTLNLLYKLE